MSEEQLLQLVASAVEKVIKGPAKISIDTDLIEDDILDSLDGMVFLLELEEATGKRFPEDIDLVAEGYYKVRKLLDFLKV
ncbi:MAG: hypothetical protein U1A72_09230 [Sulfuritalea sp.]|nr:hypothetical protein [Sulfuritalea sp.]